jgi:hypothetical protein
LTYFLGIVTENAVAAQFWRLAGFAIMSRRFSRHIIGESAATQKAPPIAATSGVTPIGPSARAQE